MSVAVDDLELRCRRCGRLLAWGEVRADGRVGWIPTALAGELGESVEWADADVVAADDLYEVECRTHGMRAPARGIVRNAIREHNATVRHEPRPTEEPTRRPLVGGRTGAVVIRA